MKASAKATLDAAQGLYESKFLSYPRTDSFYITENEHQYLVKHLQNYKKFLGIEEVQTTEIKAKKRYVDAKKFKNIMQLFRQRRFRLLHALRSFPNYSKQSICKFCALLWLCLLQIISTKRRP